MTVLCNLIQSAVTKSIGISKCLAASLVASAHCIQCCKYADPPSQGSEHQMYLASRLCL
jgi:hypothetical protein